MAAAANVVGVSLTTLPAPLPSWIDYPEESPEVIVFSRLRKGNEHHYKFRNFHEARKEYEAVLAKQPHLALANYYLMQLLLDPDYIKQLINIEKAKLSHEYRDLSKEELNTLVERIVNEKVCEEALVYAKQAGVYYIGLLLDHPVFSEYTNPKLYEELRGIYHDHNSSTEGANDKLIKRVIEFDRERIDVYIFLAQFVQVGLAVLAQPEVFEDHLQTIERLLLKHQDYPELHYVKGLILERGYVFRQDWDRAIAAYQRAADLGLKEANYRLACIYWEKYKREPERRQDYDRLIRRHLENASPSRNAAILQAEINMITGQTSKGQNVDITYRLMHANPTSLKALMLVMQCELALTPERGIGTFFSAEQSVRNRILKKIDGFFAKAIEIVSHHNYDEHLKQDTGKSLYIMACLLEPRCHEPSLLKWHQAISSDTRGNNLKLAIRLFEFAACLGSRPAMLRLAYYAIEGDSNTSLFDYKNTNLAAGFFIYRILAKQRYPLSKEDLKLRNKLFEINQQQFYFDPNRQLFQREMYNYENNLLFLAQLKAQRGGIIQQGQGDSAQQLERINDQIAKIESQINHNQAALFDILKDNTSETLFLCLLGNGLPFSRFYHKTYRFTDFDKIANFIDRLEPGTLVITPEINILIKWLSTNEPKGWGVDLITTALANYGIRSNRIDIALPLLHQVKKVELLQTTCYEIAAFYFACLVELTARDRDHFTPVLGITDGTPLQFNSDERISVSYLFSQVMKYLPYEVDHPELVHAVGCHLQLLNKEEQSWLRKRISVIARDQQWKSSERVSEKQSDKHDSIPVFLTVMLADEQKRREVLPQLIAQKDVRSIGVLFKFFPDEIIRCFFEVYQINIEELDRAIAAEAGSASPARSSRDVCLEEADIPDAEKDIMRSREQFPLLAKFTIYYISIQNVATKLNPFFSGLTSACMDNCQFLPDANIVVARFIFEYYRRKCDMRGGISYYDLTYCYDVVKHLRPEYISPQRVLQLVEIFQMIYRMPVDVMQRKLVRDNTLAQFKQYIIQQALSYLELCRESLSEEESFKDYYTFFKGEELIGQDNIAVRALDEDIMELNPRHMTSTANLKLARAIIEGIEKGQFVNYPLQEQQGLLVKIETCLFYVNIAEVDLAFIKKLFLFNEAVAINFLLQQIIMDEDTEDLRRYMQDFQDQSAYDKLAAYQRYLSDIDQPLLLRETDANTRTPRYYLSYMIQRGDIMISPERVKIIYHEILYCIGKVRRNLNEHIDVIELNLHKLFDLIFQRRDKTIVLVADQLSPSEAVPVFQFFRDIWIRELTGEHHLINSIYAKYAPTEQDRGVLERRQDFRRRFMIPFLRRVISAFPQNEEIDEIAINKFARDSRLDMREARELVDFARAENIILPPAVRSVPRLF